jgi:pentatricopeptide repeat protein
MAPRTVKLNISHWNSRFARYAKAGQFEKTLELFRQMQQSNIIPDSFTFVHVLKACANLQALEEGRCIHTQVIQSGFESNLYVGSSLVNMYAKCGSIEDAWRVFNRIPSHDAVSWNAMIMGHVRCGQGQKALELYQKMEREGVQPVPLTFVGLLNACATLSVLEDGKRVHEQTIQSGCESDIFVASSLINMYAKCGSIEDAQRVFNKMPTRDVVSWSTMILGYVKCGQGQKALELSQQMQHEGVQPVPTTFLGMLNACASVAALEEGRHVHEQIIESSCESDAFVSSSLINMYAKCGSLEDAWRVFNRIPIHTTISWNAMLGGCAMHGCAQQALGCFEQMCHEGVDMDRVTFIALLSACGHAGLRDEGLHYFESMCLVYSIPAAVEHYACMVDLHGRAGHLHDAEDLIKEMHCEPNASVWMALLSACRVYGSVEMVDRIAKQVLELDCGNSADHSS